MHTLSIFPSLLTFGIFAPFLIRLIASLFVIHLGRKRYAKEYKWTSIIYIVAGALVFVGLYTQVACLVAILVLKFDMYVDYWRTRKITPVTKETYFLYLLAEIILLSLLFTGPGFLAIDWPL